MSTDTECQRIQFFAGGTGRALVGDRRVTGLAVDRACGIVRSTPRSRTRQYESVAMDDPVNIWLLRLLHVSVALGIAGLAVTGGGIYIGIGLHGTMPNSDWVLATAGMLFLGLVSIGVAVLVRHVAKQGQGNRVRGS